MAVKTDTLETVPPHVANAAGLGGKAILFINGERWGRKITNRLRTQFTIEGAKSALIMKSNDSPCFREGLSLQAASVFRPMPFPA